MGLIAVALLGIWALLQGSGWQTFAEQFARIYVRLAIFLGLLLAHPYFSGQVLMMHLPRVLSEDAFQLERDAVGVQFERAGGFVWALLCLVVLIVAVELQLIR